jgi:cytochrome P450
VDQFLCHILQVPSALLQKKVAPTIQGLQKAVHEYTSIFGHETLRYHPFVKLANLIISETLNTLDIRFCRNDPVFVKGSFGDRKPDVVGVCYDAVREDRGAALITL